MRQELAAFDQFNLYQCFRRLVGDRHKKFLDAATLIKFLSENNVNWVGTLEAHHFITEFSNEPLREAEDLVEGSGENLCFGEVQRCFMPCDSEELRVSLSQRSCKTK